jgi:VCBS repeat-containing protein
LATLNGTTKSDSITGTALADTIYGLGGDDKLSGASGDDLIDGGAGSDKLYGGDGNDQIFGGAGVDSLSGDGGNDSLDGGDGDDTLTGGLGRDTLKGGLGNDKLIGGDGTDIAVFSGKSTDYTITTKNGVTTVVDKNLADGNDGTDNLTTVERIQFSDGTIYLTPDRIPTAAADSVTTDENTVKSSTTSVLANDSDADLDSLTVTSVAGVTLVNGQATATLASGATITMNADGTYSFDPNTKYEYLAQEQSVDVGIPYQISDGNGGAATGTLTVTITGVNDAPTVSGSVTGNATEGGEAITLNALANASDVDSGTTLSVVNVASNLPAGVTYDPNTHSFTLDSRDPSFDYLAAGETATITVDYGVSDGSATTGASASWTIRGVPEFAARNIAGDAYNGSVTVGDFNLDGKLDLVAASPWYGSSAAYLYLGNGDGTFTKAATPISTEPGLVKVNSADLNGDGKLDLITCNPGASTISVALGAGAGQFGPVATYAAPGNALFVSFGDVDQDGDLDMASGWGSQVLLYDNDGSGTFASARSLFQSAAAVDEALLVDLNGDGKTDLLYYDGATQQLHTRLGGGDGSFASDDFTLNTDFGTYSRMETGDVNGDGRVDAVLSKGDSFVVCLGNGDGSFVASTDEYPLGVVLGGNDFYLRDINGDGFLDIAGSGNQVEVLYGNGDGTFLPYTQYFAGILAGSPGMGFGDLNGDGLVDIVTANEGTGNLSIYLQRPEFIQARSANAIIEGAFGGGHVLNVGSDGSITDSGIILPNGGGDATYGGSTGYVNADSYMDVLVLSDWGGARLYYGNADGSFTDSGQSFPSAFQTRSLISDFNGDGLGDLVVLNVLGSMDVYMNNGASFTKTYSLYEHGSDGYGTIAPVFAGDLNGDGHADLYVLRDDPQNPTDQILFGDGQGGFVESGIALPPHPQVGPTVSFGDVNGDGTTDIVSGLPTGGVSVLLNDGAANFTQAGDPWPQAGSLPWLGDFDQNGTLDALLTLSPENGGMQWWSNDGAGNFSFGGSVGADFTARGVVDFNQDGAPDLYGVNGSADVVYLNDGHGHFSPAGSLNIGQTFLMTDYLFATA